MLPRHRQGLDVRLLAHRRGLQADAHELPRHVLALLLRAQENLVALGLHGRRAALRLRGALVALGGAALALRGARLRGRHAGEELGGGGVAALRLALEALLRLGDGVGRGGTGRTRACVEGS